ncbi:MAG TPA: undecaprenyl-diphosphate phosphatase, partial [Mycobacteriales bacterium]|nr:undecaprenyl-diphosphate phosphatase [Mycobacteriales bacterium]
RGVRDHERHDGADQRGHGASQLPSALDEGVGAVPTLVGTVVSFVVAYASIAWLLRFVAHHSIAWFVPYRVALGVAVLVGVAVT